MLGEGEIEKDPSLYLPNKNVIEKYPSSNIGTLSYYFKTQKQLLFHNQILLTCFFAQSGRLCKTQFTSRKHLNPLVPKVGKEKSVV
jgi:hypothetical protein